MTDSKFSKIYHIQEDFIETLRNSKMQVAGNEFRILTKIVEKL